MLCISFIIMYAVMYLNVDKFNHIYISLNRIYMTTLMVTAMALLMIAFMPSMYQNKKLNNIINGTCIGVFLIVFFLLRTQTFVNDKQFMKSMIPHHSSAILVSHGATLKDPKVRDLAREIIESQEREINQMKDILAKMEK